MGNKMEEISSQRKLEALEENGTFIRKKTERHFCSWTAKMPKSSP